jgi:hypothetical protein
VSALSSRRQVRATRDQVRTLGVRSRDKTELSMLLPQPFEKPRCEGETARTRGPTGDPERSSVCSDRMFSGCLVRGERAIQIRGMSSDYSWESSARAYQQVYEWAIARMGGVNLRVAAEGHAPEVFGSWVLASPEQSPRQPELPTH